MRVSRCAAPPRSSSTPSSALLFISLSLSLSRSDKGGSNGASPLAGRGTDAIDAAQSSGSYFLQALPFGDVSYEMTRSLNIPSPGRPRHSQPSAAVGGREVG